MEPGAHGFGLFAPAPSGSWPWDFLCEQCACRRRVYPGCVKYTQCMKAEGRKPTISLRLPPELLERVDRLVRRTAMRSRTEFIQRALEAYVEEVEEAKVVRIRPYGEAEAREAILHYLDDHPGTYVSDVAEALSMDLELAFRTVKRLSEEGEVVG